MAAPGRCEEAVLGDVRALAEAVRGVCRTGQPPLAAGPPASSTTNCLLWCRLLHLQQLYTKSLPLWLKK